MFSGRVQNKQALSCLEESFLPRGTDERSERCNGWLLISALLAGCAASPAKFYADSASLSDTTLSITLKTANSASDPAFAADVRRAVVARNLTDHSCQTLVNRQNAASAAGAVVGVAWWLPRAIPAVAGRLLARAAATGTTTNGTGISSTAKTASSSGPAAACRQGSSPMRVSVQENCRAIGAGH
jgi:hypothetical protein